ncbi:hypothetical protein CC1G_02551 [Coprinopsis cinerea okayama7|uniref:Uncharacterized protein n=1 Tax=Coprinopsis cinerea (strain Okayama-7 / 130 / ATCC MYA-4618 / FGSC 9003) TaxID=240176 RepID=A8NBU1_COPC7|nr:hypothetical protein CC1G_02551 [Coprinopsis cinerea okayama7\|eukprot:XP_001832289.2 hypothetical protein CC1G_02551 [Coprinopsis cinerea okayama7\
MSSYMPGGVPEQSIPLIWIRWIHRRYRIHEGSQGESKGRLVYFQTVTDPRNDVWSSFRVEAAGASDSPRLAYMTCRTPDQDTPGVSRWARFTGSRPMKAVSHASKNHNRHRVTSKRKPGPSGVTRQNPPRRQYVKSWLSGPAGVVHQRHGTDSANISAAVGDNSTNLSPTPPNRKLVLNVVLGAGLEVRFYLKAKCNSSPARLQRGICPVKQLVSNLRATKLRLDQGGSCQPPICNETLPAWAGHEGYKEDERGVAKYYGKKL